MNFELSVVMNFATVLTVKNNNLSLEIIHSICHTPLISINLSVNYFNCFY